MIRAGLRALRSLHERLRSHRARKCSRSLARRASSKPQSSKTDPQEASQSLEKASKTITLSVFRHFWSKRPHERSETLPEAPKRPSRSSRAAPKSVRAAPKVSQDAPGRLLRGFKRGPKHPRSPKGGRCCLQAAPKRLFSSIFEAPEFEKAEEN